ncbi:hypothetical protein H6761_00985 [Candidatus Nomurabacteria bacterium]|nr:hypothetical protein [Candidatus Nomurabacteria bacterium]
MSILRTTRKIYRDFFTVALCTWLLLVIVEFIDRGSVHRFINLEYWFYFLLLASLVFVFFPNKR